MNWTTADHGSPGQDFSGHEVAENETGALTRLLREFLLQNPPPVLSLEQLLIVLVDLTRRISSLERRQILRGECGCQEGRSGVSP